MISYGQALQLILDKALCRGIENVEVEDSVGRVLKEDVVSKIEMPPFDKSAMDGYAVFSKDILRVPSKLKCIGHVEAGTFFRKKIKSGECVKIMTGAPLPENTDCVVMLEDTVPSGVYVKIIKRVKKGENLCFKGEDIKRGKKVLSKGSSIRLSHVALLAALGKSVVKVVKFPRISILNTGGEIVPLGKRLGKGQIYNSNGPMLTALVKSEGLEPLSLGIAKDRPLDLKNAIKKGLKGDILLISGGVSMGDYDLVPAVLKMLHVKKIFHKVNIKPGKPLFFAVKKNCLIFGVPGNPVSGFLSYLSFIRPAIRKIMGEICYRPDFKEGILEKKTFQKTGRRHFIPVKICRKKDKYHLMPLSTHGSADIFSISKADGFMSLDAARVVAGKKSKIPFISWQNHES